MESNWYTVSEIINRQIGCNPWFDRKFYGSLNTITWLEPIYKVKMYASEDFPICDLSFNRNGNLLASCSYNDISIWDWAKQKKILSLVVSPCFSNISKIRWLPCDQENYIVALCEYGDICLLDLKGSIVPKLIGKCTENMVMHPELPYNILTVTAHGKVILIDIRESKSHILLTERYGSSNMFLCSVDSNPLNSNEFCIGGQSPYVMVYDMRNLLRPILKQCPRHMKFKDYSTYTMRTLYNYNGREILVSYSLDDLYLFDTLKSLHNRCRNGYIRKYRFQSIMDKLKYQRTFHDLGVINFFGPKSEYIISASEYVIFWDKNTAYVAHTKEAKYVQCMAIHPRFPILVTNNIERTHNFDVWTFSNQEITNL